MNKTAPYFDSSSVTIYNADSHEAWKHLDVEADALVTSPPYWSLRDYGVDGQLGLESGPEQYVEELADLLTGYGTECMKPAGSLWLNLGDTFSTGSGNPSGGMVALGERLGTGGGHKVQDAPIARPALAGVPSKCLLMIPERVALALIARGWILRNKVVWAKPNGMPSSVADRLATKWEYVFHLVRQQRYYYNLDAIKEPAVYADGGADGSRTFGGKAKASDGKYGSSSRTYGRIYEATGSRHHSGHHMKNPGDVWWCDEEELRFPAGVLTSDEAAYMAAFIDGEGSISIRRRRRQIQFMLTVVNTHEGIIRWLHERTGMGQIKQREVRNEKWRQVWEWSVTSRQAAQVVHAVYPHLRVKQQQAAVALYFMETTRPAGGGAAPDEYHERRQAMAEDVAALNAGRIAESKFALDPVQPKTSSAGDVWSIATQPYPKSHFAVYPPKLIERPILATVPEGGTVLDPFFGSGTTGVVARKLGRKAIGVELNPDYCQLAASRFTQEVLNFGATKPNGQWWPT